jgi:glucose/arabinose dehydrogenase
MSQCVFTSLGTACMTLFVSGIAVAATLPAGFRETRVASGLSRPTALTVAPDGRIFICEQGGRLRVVRGGRLLPTPFVTVRVNSTGERGLLGVAVDPNFANNRFVYVYYTATTPSVHNRVSRFTANAGGDVAVAGSERVLLDLNTLNATNHNGGAIHFGADGRLYIAVGENARPSSAQSLSNLLGKMLRINSNGTIPSDNPFFNQTTGRNRAIWARGLRNPFTFAVQPGTGRIFINDVGSSGGNAWEEINQGVRGANYGWPTTEGPTTDPRFRSPIHAYRLGSSGTCAIVGGAFYNPPTATFPSSFVGDYFFADLCGGFIRRRDGTTVRGFATNIPSPVDLAVGRDGALYYLTRGNSSLFRVQATTAAANLTDEELSLPIPEEPPVEGLAIEEEEPPPASATPK